jgi:tRNA(Ile)-lysidine synthase
MDQVDQRPPIVPPQSLEQAWSREHLRLHRLLLRQPQLLPPGASLLLAVSGGQDSMALLGLLLGLRRLHRWRLLLWHGDHSWRAESAQQASALAAWCSEQGLLLVSDHWTADASDGHRHEAGARQWRYAALAQQARVHGCSHVVTGHTASDRAETLLLHLARGSDRRGLASLSPLRPLGSDGLQLSRPLLIFSRDETGSICRQLALPTWLDPSNGDPRFSRNRIRAEVLPVLEALHPGAAQRLSGTAERLRQQLASDADWHRIALQWLSDGNGGLDRRRFAELQRSNQGTVLAQWLQQQGVTGLTARQINTLLDRLQPGQGPGQGDLAGGWRLRWDRSKLELNGP